jgi:SPP1 family predicted phage head-tail adaptor
MISNFFDKTFSVYSFTHGVTFPYDESWALVSTFAGCLEQLSGKEVFYNGQLGIIASHRIYCPYTTTVTEAQRLIYDSRTFEVESIDGVETHSGHHKEILVKEIK